MGKNLSRIIKLAIVTILILSVTISAFSWSWFKKKNEKKEVVLRMGDNIPDRNSPWGIVIEKINAEFEKQHPGVKIETESLQDQPYQEKMKIYAASDQLPDVFKYWSFSTLLGPLVEAGYVMPLNERDFKKYNFIPGSLESNIYNGKLYGIPVSCDFWVIYYNKKLFEEAGVEIPKTMEELIALAPKFMAKNIIPMVTDGKDGWPLSITIDNLLGRVENDFSHYKKALNREIKYTDPILIKVAEKYADFFQSGLFQKDLLTSDYGASQNLFGQQKAAMYIMGSWEMGLSTNQAFSEEFRNNVGAFKVPKYADGKGNEDNLMAWYGGNYVINSKSEYKDLALEYLKLYAELFPKLAWDIKATFPAQKVNASPSDNELSKTLIKILGDAKKTSGTGALDLSTPEFKETHQNLCKQLAGGMISPEEFCQELDKAAEKAAKK